MKTLVSVGVILLFVLAGILFVVSLAPGTTTETAAPPAVEPSMQAQPQPSADPEPPATDTLDLSDCVTPLDGRAIYERLLYSVVHILAQSAEGEATGSGFVYRQGWIATNQHVVEGAINLSLRFADGTTRPATVAWADADEDLALLRVQSWPAQTFVPLARASWRTASPGDDVYVMGAPLALEWSLSKGIVSSLRAESVDGRPHIQVDAAVNAGNSGGPLVDACARVIGVIRMKARGVGTGSAMQVENLNFARPVDVLVDHARRLGI